MLISQDNLRSERKGKDNMANFFRNQQTVQEVPLRQALETKYSNARHNILVILAFTVINVILLVSNSNTYFLFSAYVPYLFADAAMLLCGMYPSEYYDAEFTGMEFFGKEVFAVFMAIVAVILIVYLLCWIFSKKKAGWMIAALAFFCIDTGIMLLLYGIDMEMLVDIIFHGWVIFSLAGGVSAHNKLKKLPEEQVLTCDQQENGDVAAVGQQD